MIKKRKQVKLEFAILIAVTILALIIYAVYATIKFINKDSDKSNASLTYITTHKIVENNTTTEIKVNIETKERYLYINGKKKEKLGEVKTDPSKYMETPDTSKLETYKDITTQESKDPITWKSSIEESAKFIGLLENSGYTILREANTPNYVELFFQKENTIKRVVIFTENILVADTLNKVLPQIDTYYSK